MKNVFKILNVTFTACLIFSLMLCCCLTKLAQAKTETVPSCHQHTSKTNKTDSSSKCECHKQVASAEVKNFNLLKLDLNNGFSIAFNKSAVLPSSTTFSFVFQKSPPPGFQEIPQYIRFHNFRI